MSCCTWSHYKLWHTCTRSHSGMENCHKQGSVIASSSQRKTGKTILPSSSSSLLFTSNLCSQHKPEFKKAHLPCHEIQPHQDVKYCGLIMLNIHRGLMQQPSAITFYHLMAELYLIYNPRKTLNLPRQDNIPKWANSKLVTLFAWHFLKCCCFYFCWFFF